jgi:hypothetical protein
MTTTAPPLTSRSDLVVFAATVESNVEVALVGDLVFRATVELA